MPRFSKTQDSFNSGEISPEIQGRLNLDNYKTGAKTVENFIVTPEGGLHRRSGTRYVSGTVDNAKRSVLTPFVASDGTSYQLEFGNGVIRVFKGVDRVYVSNRTWNHDISTADTVDAAANEFFSKDHGYRDGQGPSRLYGTNLPVPLSASTNYYIRKPQTRTIQTISSGSDQIVTTVDHEYQDGQGPFRIRAVAAETNVGLEDKLDINTPIDSFTDYDIDRINNSTFKLESGGVTVDIDATPVRHGTWEIAPTKDYLRDSFQLSLTPGGSTVALTSWNPLAGDFTITANPIISIGWEDNPIGLPVEIASPYMESDIQNLRFAQSPEALFIVHNNHRPAQLTRVSDSQWALSDVAFIDGPYLDDNEGTLTVDSHVLGARNTLTLSSQDIINDGEGWRFSDIGRVVRFNRDGSSPGYVEIDSHTSRTVATGTNFQFAGGVVGAHTQWQLGAWYTGNYPGSVALAEQRLCFANETAKPNFVTTSNTGALNVMRPTKVDDTKTVVASNSVRVGIADRGIHLIKWLSVGKKLMVGTNAAIFSLRGTLDGEAFGPGNINAIKISSTGASLVAPIDVSREMVYLTNNSQGIRGLETSDTADSSTEQPPFDLALLARHIFGRTLSIEEVDYQFDRRSIIWLVRSDGVLLGCTYVPEQSVYAWHTHVIGGSFSTGNAVVESVSVDKNTGGSFDRVWLIVKRTIGGTTVRYVEFFEDEWLDGVSTSQKFVDCHPVAYSSLAVPQLKQFDTFGHLIGETIQVLGSGAVLPDATVTEPTAGTGRVTTLITHRDLVAGYGYTSTFKSLPINLPESKEQGASMGKMARFDHAVLRLWNSQTGEIGVPEWDGNVAKWTSIIERGAGDVHGSQPSPFTGDIKVSLDGGFDREMVVVIRQRQPVGFHLLSMNIMGSSGQR